MINSVVPDDELMNKVMGMAETAGPGADSSDRADQDVTGGQRS